MPELPEVENFARSLNLRFGGLRLKSIQYHRDDLRFPFDKASLGKIMHPGAQLIRVAREGKQICLAFDSGSVFVSLGMSGSFIEVPKGRSIPHQHLTWSFKGRAETLGYVDPRRFGFLTTTAPHPAPSPLDPAETAQALLAIKGQGSRRRLRDVLLDQKILGGVGNIYMCEACFAAGVDPLAEMASITPQRIKRLATALASILDRAIALGGSSISTYRQFGGAQGGAQDVHRVYGREGEPCKGAGCPGIVIRRSVGGRSVFLCPRCQK